MYTHTHPSAPRWPIVSQLDPRLYNRPEVQRQLLPHLIWLWQQVEDATGYRWMSTSYWRDSPSHQYGYALDIAPDVANDSKEYYSTSRWSDPVLYKRKILIRKLQTLKDDVTPAPLVYGIFIEPDHLHLHIALPNARFKPGVYVFKWKVPKPVYDDTYERMKLPAFDILSL
jgi:hypothetical protein